MSNQSLRSLIGRGYELAGRASALPMRADSINIVLGGVCSDDGQIELAPNTPANSSAIADLSNLLDILEQTVASTEKRLAVAERLLDGGSQLYLDIEQEQELTKGVASSLATGELRNTIL